MQGTSEPQPKPLNVKLPPKGHGVVSEDRVHKLAKPGRVVVDLGGRKRAYIADRWEFPDGLTLRIYLGNKQIKAFGHGKWKAISAYEVVETVEREEAS